MGDKNFVGCKISLISNCQIRYEGILYTVDAPSSTLVLQKVRSFGTEDRPAAKLVPPKDEVYECIVFKATDIQDIKICETPGLPDDPAIVQHYPGSRSLPSAPYYGQVNNLAHYGAYGGFGNYGGSSVDSAGTSGAPLGTFIPGDIVPEMAASVNQLSDLNNCLELEQSASIPTGSLAQRETVPPLLEAIGSRSSNATPTTAMGIRKSPTVDREVQVSKEDRWGKDEKWNRGDQWSKQDKWARNDQWGAQKTSNFNGYQGRQFFDRNTQSVPQQRAMNNRGMRGGRRPRRKGFETGKSIKPLTTRFNEDYDFEQANFKFEELRSELAKTQLSKSEEPKKPVAIPNGELEKKEDSGNETAGGEEQIEEESDLQYYDRTKSFFDNISCEAIERSKGGERKDWRQERLLNKETFGRMAATYVNKRGGYRGRGGYMRGGFNRGNYRGGRGNRGTGRGGYHNSWMGPSNNPPREH